ncbi:Na+/melibiose symporter and related transporters [Enterobacter cloacae]|uniref:Na+/melibiose symporter and related transporters n=1 Tax=Enterobacter cloacae TaxID=550 RepID=A0A377M0A4_ENTCL|nr:Na+/melibiose symporter and related transporters [Enterobacter cloacae]
MRLYLVEGDLGTRVNPRRCWAELETSTAPRTLTQKLAAFGRLFKEYGSTLKIRAFRKHLAIYLLSFTGKDVYNTVLSSSVFTA